MLGMQGSPSTPPAFYAAMPEFQAVILACDVDGSSTPSCLFTSEGSEGEDTCVRES